MNIAIIGAGNIGGALAEGWAKKGHRIFFGVRNPNDFKADELLSAYNTITVHTVAEAVRQADVILVSTPAKAVADVAAQLGDASFIRWRTTCPAIVPTSITYTPAGSTLTREYPNIDQLECSCLV